MFGLTKREQRWEAQERGYQMILEHTLAIRQSNAILETERLKNENLKLEKELLEIKARLNKEPPNE